MDIEAIVFNTARAWAYDKGTSWTDHMRAALTELSAAHAIELRAYEATVENQAERIRQLEAELERLRKDAERIEFMSSHARQVVKNWEWVGSTGFRQAIDTQIRLNEKAADDQADAIDAAIAAEGK